MGAFADPSTGMFHQGFLYTPSNVTGRNAGAGARTSDFVTWTDLTAEDPSFIRSGGKNDEIAVFDGTVIPSGVDGLPTLICGFGVSRQTSFRLFLLDDASDTSVAYLPISWTVPYIPGSETQSIAVSNDSGVTFNKLERGPVLASAPFGVDPIGWRDPFMFQNPQFDDLLNSTEGAWYSESIPSYTDRKADVDVQWLLAVVIGMRKDLVYSCTDKRMRITHRGNTMAFSGRKSAIPLGETVHGQDDGVW